MASTQTQIAASSTAPSIITESMQRLLQVRDLWTRSQKDQLEIGRLCYLERNERFSVGGRSIHEGFAAWCKEAGMSRASAYRRIAEYEISIGEREEETVKKPVSCETSFEPAAYYQTDRKFCEALDFLKANPQSNVSVRRDTYTGKRGGTAVTWAVRVDNTEASRFVDATSEKNAESKKKHLIALGTESKPPETTAAPVISAGRKTWTEEQVFEWLKEKHPALYAHYEAKGFPRWIPLPPSIEVTDKASCEYCAFHSSSRSCPIHGWTEKRTDHFTQPTAAPAVEDPITDAMNFPAAARKSSPQPDPEFVRLRDLAKDAGYHLATSARDGKYDLLGLTAAQVEIFIKAVVHG